MHFNNLYQNKVFTPRIVVTKKSTTNQIFNEQMINMISFFNPIYCLMWSADLDSFVALVYSQ